MLISAEEQVTRIREPGGDLSGTPRDEFICGARLGLRTYADRSVEASEPAPAWDHQEVVFRLAGALDDYVRTHGLKSLLVSPADPALASEDDLRPDIAVIPRSAARRAHPWTDMRALVLVVEVIAPGVLHYDRIIKRNIYLRHGVAEYWVVDPGLRCVDRWRRGSTEHERFDRTIVWEPPRSTTVMAVDLKQFFAGVLRERRRRASR